MIDARDIQEDTAVGGQAELDDIGLIVLAIVSEEDDL